MAGSRRDVRVRRGLAAVQTRPNANQNELYELLASARRTLVQIFAQVDSTQLEIKSANDYHKIAVALSSLLKSQVEYERWQAERFGCVIEGATLVTEEVRRQLVNQPVLLAQLNDVIREARDNVEAQHGASPHPDQKQAPPIPEMDPPPKIEN